MSDENINQLEQTEDKETKLRAINTVKNSGFEDLLNQVSSELNLNSTDQKLEIPIPVEKLPESDKKFTISNKVSDFLGALTEIINDPDNRLSVEVPFCLSGSNDKLDTASTLYKDFHALETKKVDFDAEKFSGAINRAIKSDKIDTFVLCHTHPLLSGEDMKDVVTTKISSELKTKYGIKKAGYNFSLQDLYGLQWLQENFGKKIRVSLGVLLPNGRLALAEIDNNKFKLIKTDIEKTV